MSQSFMEGAAGGGDEQNESSRSLDASGVFNSGRSFIGAAGDTSYLSQSRTSYFEDDRFTCLQDLHHGFVRAITNMPSRLQMFEVIDEWMVYIEKTLELPRHADPDIPDDVYQKVRLILKKEYETWDLLKTLYYERLYVKEGVSEPYNTPIYDRYHLDDFTHAQAIVQGDVSLQEMETIIAWLEMNHSRNPEPDLTPKNFVWEQTLECLKRDKLLGKDLKIGPMVSCIDPDAPTREGKSLHPLDEAEELRIQRSVFSYFRRGNVDKAIAFLSQSGHFVKAQSLSGSRMSQMIPKDDNQEDDEMNGVVSKNSQVSRMWLPEGREKETSIPEIMSIEEPILQEYPFDWKVTNSDAALAPRSKFISSESSSIPISTSKLQKSLSRKEIGGLPKQNKFSSLEKEDKDTSSRLNCDLLEDNLENNEMEKNPYLKYPKPDYKVIGNPGRDLWKSVAWMVCEAKNVPKWERAVVGANCKHREAMLSVANTWEDKLWSYLKSSVDTKVEHKLRSLHKTGSYMGLPSEYWAQSMSIEEILNKIEPTLSSTLDADNMFHFLQKAVMLNDIQGFIPIIEDHIDELFSESEHPVILDHIIRFLTHLLLALAIVELPYSENLTNNSCEAFIRVLVRSQQFVTTPFYVQKLSSEVQIPVIVSQIDVERDYSTDEIKDFLEAAADNELDILGIGMAVVDKIKSVVDHFNVDSLQWISLCYDLMEGQEATVLVQLLRYTVVISRKYLTLGDLDRAKKIIEQISSDIINEVVGASGELGDTLVREFICYREYLEAEEAHKTWRKGISQKPSWNEYDELKGPSANSVADKRMWQKKKAEFENAKATWRTAVEFHSKTAVDKFMEVLKFPGGWLHGCCDPKNEDEIIHVSAVRRIITKKVVFILLNLVKGQSVKTFKEFIYVLCEPRKKILDEFTPEEIGCIFKVAEEFTRKRCPNLIELPK